MTITCGCLKGRVIKTPAGKGTRPLLTRLRKSLADILRPRLAGALILDLFGGSGAIAFELLSNGAAEAVIVELDPAAAELIRANARGLGLEAVVEVLRGDGIESVEGLARKKDAFDIIIVAPPYGQGLQARALAALARQPVLKPQGLIILQREHREGQVPAPAGLALVRTRGYGRTMFDFYETRAEGAQPVQKA